MGKKVEKGLNKEKNQSATSQDETDSNKALDITVTADSDHETCRSDEETLQSQSEDEPYNCTGNFQADFSEICRRNNMTYIPPVVMRPRPPGAQIQQESSPAKGGKGDKGKQAQPEPEPEEVTEDGEPAEAPPKTYTTKDKFEYFKPCIQVEQDHQDKPETVTEIYIRGWKIDSTMMDTFKECWQTMEKLHTINLWSTGLNNETLATLSSFIPQCSSLRNLTLDGNVADGENWYELIMGESPVQNLSLRHCGITDKGAIMIGRCLGSTKRSNVKLFSLNLANNKITDAGMEEIAQGLRMNRTLLSLSLASNYIGNKGAIKLAEVLSRFPLTHEEVVERRRQKSDRASPDRNKSPPLSRRADSRDRPGSVRSNIHVDKDKKKDKPTSKKKDAKGGKEEKEEKHDKGPAAAKGKKEKEEKGAAKKGGGANIGGRSSGASIAADAGKGKIGKVGKGGRIDKGKLPQPDHEASDSPEFINPLLEGADFIDGQLWVSGNRVLININLSRNKIGVAGMDALVKAMEYQTKLPDNKSNGTGLMRLVLGKNCVSADHDLSQKLNDIMLPKDPFYKPPPPTPEQEA